MYQLKKYKVARRLGAHLFEKTSTEKFTMRAERYAGKPGRKHMRGATDYGKQMLEKQRVRALYGIRERQFGKYVAAVIAAHNTNQSERLFETLESRLDNVVYRMGLCPTRQAARQAVSHGHVRVNGVKSTVPSHTVSKGDTIAIRPGSKTKGPFAQLSAKASEKTGSTPSWLSVDYGTLEGKVTDSPKLEASTSLIDLAQVLEFYKR